MKVFRVKNDELGSLCGAMAHLLGAGFSIGDAMTLLAQEETEPRLRQKLEKMASQADGGMALHAMFEAAGCFPAYVCTLLKVGETTGKTEEALHALSTYYDGRARMNRRLKASVRYPAMLLCVLLAVICILLIWVMPVFQEVYAQLGAGLTGLAGALLSLGQFLRKALPWIGGIVVVLSVLAAIRTVRQRVVTFFKNQFGDKGVFGNVNAARYLQALALGISCGMIAQEAAALSAGLAKEAGRGFQIRCEKIQTRLDNGDALSQVLRETGILPARDARLLEAGIRSGHTEEVLRTIADDRLLRSEEELERAAEKAEPAMVGVACVLIGTVLLAVMLPLMNIMNAIG